MKLEETAEGFVEIIPEEGEEEELQRTRVGLYVGSANSMQGHSSFIVDVQLEADSSTDPAIEALYAKVKQRTAPPIPPRVYTLPLPVTHQSSIDFSCDDVSLELAPSRRSSSNPTPDGSRGSTPGRTMSASPQLRQYRFMEDDEILRHGAVKLTAPPRSSITNSPTAALVRPTSLLLDATSLNMAALRARGVAMPAWNADDQARMGAKREKEEEDTTC